MARVINEIAVHCSATKPDHYVTAADIDGWHKKRGWNGIGYHWVIRRDGSIEQGRDEDTVGAHVFGHNAASIGVCLIGGVDTGGDPDANFTYAQYSSLKLVIDDIRMRHTIKSLSGHRDYPAVTKTCPCFDVRAFYGEL